MTTKPVTLRVRFAFNNTDGDDVRSVQDFVNGLHRRLRPSGGSAYALRRPGAVLIEATVPSKRFLLDRLARLVNSFRRSGRDFLCVVADKISARLTLAEIKKLEVLRAERVRLTRKLFFSCSAGDFIFSNNGRAPGKPCFSETIGAPEGREAQWREIVRSGFALRPCRIFPSEEAYYDWAQL